MSLKNWILILGELPISSPTHCLQTRVSDPSLLLHPDMARRDSRESSRRGSTQSDISPAREGYTLNQTFPHSLPQSRRGSVSYSRENSLDKIKGKKKLDKPYIIIIHI